MRGRKPTPTFLRVIRGNPSKRAMPKNEPKPRGDLFVAPDYLTEPQRKAWTYAVANGVPGLLKRNDAGMLAAYCMALVTVIDCNEKLAEMALVVRAGTVKAPLLVGNPYERIRRQNIALMVKIASEIGFTPASRTRIELMPDTVADDEWAAILEN